MQIPRYWSRANEVVVLPNGTSRTLRTWGWSDVSRGEADRHARERLAGLVGRLRRGEALQRGYAYGSRPPREEILETVIAGGEVEAVLTRNAYGSLVLNAARTLFVDVDLPPPTLRERLRRMVGYPGHEELARGHLVRCLQAMRGSFRLYRTPAGFRILASDPTFTPGSADAERIMRDLGADPAFTQLCRAQRSFRARLTPKPWRIGMQAPPTEFPREDAAAQEAFAVWLQAYRQACAGRATCRFLEAVGSARVHPANARILQLHDTQTQAESGLPLA